MIDKREKRYRRHRRVRVKVKGTKEHPRFSIFRSNQHIYGQLIDDEKGYTLLNVSDLEIKGAKNQKLKTEKEKIKTKISLAYQVGRLIAKKALDNGIKEIVFDRGGYKYHGRVKAMADGAREGGLKF
jgi:large subunit ribosomal protein L18